MKFLKQADYVANKLIILLCCNMFIILNMLQQSYQNISKSACRLSQILPYKEIPKNRVGPKTRATFFVEYF